MNRMIGKLAGMTLVAGAMLQVMEGRALAQDELALEIVSAEFINQALLRVTVSYTCPPPDPDRVGSAITVSVSQAVGGEVARGSGNVMNLACTGAPQTAEVRVLPETNVPFHGGCASIGGELAVCESSFCTTLHLDPEPFELKYSS